MDHQNRGNRGNRDPLMVFGTSPLGAIGKIGHGLVMRRWDFEATLNHGYIRPTLFNMYYFVVGSSTDQ